MRISESLVMKKPVVIDVKFGPVPDICFNNNCKENPARVDSSLITARKDQGPVYRFPRALLKQKLDLHDSESPDMAITFNSNVSWYIFQGGEYDQVNIGQQYDLELWATRLIAQGLGFQSGIFYRTQISTNTSYLTPDVITIQDPKNPRFSLSKFGKFNAFDSLLTHHTRPLLETMQYFDNFPAIRTVSSAQYLQYFESKQVLFKKSAYSSHRVLTQNSAVPVTGIEYRLQASVDNSDSVLKFELSKQTRTSQSFDFPLGQIGTQPGFSYRNQMAKNKYYQAFSPSTVKLFEALGYDSTNVESMGQFEIVDLDASNLNILVDDSQEMFTFSNPVTETQQDLGLPSEDSKLPGANEANLSDKFKFKIDCSIVGSAICQNAA